MITTNRSEFVGSHVTPEVKEAIIKQASKERMSVSRFVYETLKKLLKVKDAGAY